ncbi:MAG: hypothetical protein NWF14_08420 [Candidatus Bathyarchaeota archaeon]|nr:hypothetical protein [Candidatus Bathyarchaeota archaeon]
MFLKDGVDCAASNVLGTKSSLEEIGEMAREVDVFLKTLNEVCESGQPNIRRRNGDEPWNLPFFDLQAPAFIHRHRNI